MHKIVFVTCLLSGDDAMTLIEEEMKTLFNSEKIPLSFFHGETSAEAIASSLEGSMGKNPFYLVLHHTCDHRRIVQTMQTVKVQLPQAKIHYRKSHENEQLQASMKRIPCFSLLLKELDINIKKAPDQVQQSQEEMAVA
ncbi:MAG: hypothetical protein V4478_01735 [Patescibacteria group bacterium]